MLPSTSYTSSEITSSPISIVSGSAVAFDTIPGVPSADTSGAAAGGSAAASASASTGGSEGYPPASPVACPSAAGAGPLSPSAGASSSDFFSSGSFFFSSYSGLLAFLSPGGLEPLQQPPIFL